MREGAFKQLFGNPNDPAQKCYTAFMTMRDSYDKVPDLSEQDAYGFFKGLKRQAELQISFFTWYDDCNLMRVNIEIGKRVSSMAGFFHMIVNTIFRIWSQTDNPEWRAYVVATID